MDIGGIVKKAKTIGSLTMNNRVLYLKKSLANQEGRLLFYDEIVLGFLAQRVASVAYLDFQETRPTLSSCGCRYTAK